MRGVGGPSVTLAVAGGRTVFRAASPVAGANKRPSCVGPAIRSVCARLAGRKGVSMKVALCPRCGRDWYPASVILNRCYKCRVIYCEKCGRSLDCPACGSKNVSLNVKQIHPR